MINKRTIQKLQADDGLTLKNGKIINYKTGWQVATDGIECKTVTETMRAIKNYDGNCGVWYSNNIYYVDHSMRVNTKREALKIGKQFNQISIWGWKSQKLAYVTDECP